MNKVLILLLLFYFRCASAQNIRSVSEQLSITGKVKKEKIYSLADIQHWPAIQLNDINISCSPRKSEKAKSVKAVLLKSILDSVRFDYQNPKSLGQFYFLFVSGDGYKTVFSFNEIYNTETGNQLFIVTEIDGIKMVNMDNRILLLSNGDIKGGSRNMKGLTRIEVRSAE